MEKAPNHSAAAVDAKLTVALRLPDTVTRLARIGSFHQTRLSFMRALLRRLAGEGWTFERTVWNIDAKGEGHAVYEARGNGRVYSLIAYANDLDPSKRTDRVIAEEWDSTFTLHDGVATGVDIERLSRNVPKQEAGRYSANEIVLARANKSVRLFETIADQLAKGEQPRAAELDAVGYLMRTTAVYGSGKFGLADHETIRDRPEFSGPFMAEMLAVWLIRAYTVDLVEHMARVKAPATAARLAPTLRRRLGVGNSTGLGMAPFLVNHPALLNRWITARETALARVRSVKYASAGETAVFRDMLARGQRQMDEWNVDDAVQKVRIKGLRRDLTKLAAHIAQTDLAAESAWDKLYRYAEKRLGYEAQEFLVTLLIEPYGRLVDDLVETMACDETEPFRIDGSMTVRSMIERIEDDYRFATGTNFNDPSANARFWYVSEEKLEPRLGERGVDHGAELEQPLAVARDIKAFRAALSEYAPDAQLAEVLLQHPEFRHVARRVQIAATRPYAEIHDNLIDVSMRPIDLLRCKLSFFGASGFDPRSDRWVRIALFRHAPFPEELAAMDPDNWAIPPLDAAEPAPGTGDAIAEPARPSPNLPAGNRFSLNELDALVRKAARGCGLSWGLAEEAGKAARIIAAVQADLLTSLADMFEASINQSNDIETHGAKWEVGAACPANPIVLGTAICDHVFKLRDGSLQIDGTIAEQGLLLPFLATASRLCQHPLHVTTETGVFSCTADGWAPDAAAILAGEKTITIEIASDGNQIGRAKPVRGVALSDPLRKRFEQLAHCTYVLSSVESRAKGAGAGLNDND